MVHVKCHHHHMSCHRRSLKPIVIACLFYAYQTALPLMPRLYTSPMGIGASSMTSAIANVLSSSSTAFKLVGRHALLQAPCSRRRERLCVACGSRTCAVKLVRYPYRTVSLVRPISSQCIRRGGGEAIRHHLYQKRLLIANPRPVVGTQVSPRPINDTT